MTMLSLQSPQRWRVRKILWLVDWLTVRVAWIKVTIPKKVVWLNQKLVTTNTHHLWVFHCTYVDLCMSWQDLFVFRVAVWCFQSLPWVTEWVLETQRCRNLMNLLIFAASCFLCQYQSPVHQGPPGNRCLDTNSVIGHEKKRHSWLLSH